MSDIDSPTLTELASAHPRTTSMAALAGGTLAWYAMPDLVRSRGARVLLKAGILLGMGAAAGFIGPTADGARSPERRKALSAGLGRIRATAGRAPAGTALTVGAAAVAVWATARGEEWLFRRGERRRVMGRPAPHLRQAVPLALAVAAAQILDPRGAPAAPRLA